MTGPSDAERPDDGLSPREAEVLSWVARGYSNKRIGDHLGISVHTVVVHLTHIFRKLQVGSRTEAAAYYFHQVTVRRDLRDSPDSASPANTVGTHRSAEGPGTAG